MRERASLLPRQVRRADSRIRDAKAVRGVSGVGSTWASYIIGERARKLHKHDPLRCDLLSRLEMMADAAEAAPVPAALQVYMGSPALHKAVEAQETAASAALGPRRQGRRDRGSCVWIVCLRRVPFAPCMWYDLGARSCAPASSTGARAPLDRSGHRMTSYDTTLGGSTSSVPQVRLVARDIY